MKRVHIIFAAIILVMLPICSCRSHKQAVAEYADTTTVAVMSTEDTHTSDDILSVITSIRDLDMQDIHIEFYPPDTLHPDIRPSPKSLDIASAKSHAEDGETTARASATDGRKAVNASARNSSRSQNKTKTDSDTLRPADWVLFLWETGAVLVILLLLLYLRRKSRNK